MKALFNEVVKLKYSPLHFFTFTGLFVIFTSQAWSQAPGIFTPPAPAPGQSPTPAKNTTVIEKQPEKSQKNFLGSDIPFLDPSTEIISWNGKMWNINNNRIFRARFEKYLNAKAQTEKEDEDYREVLTQIMNLLAPDKINSPNIDEAWGLLPKASSFRLDANLCDSLANTVYGVWLSKRQDHRLEKANHALERQLDMARWNAGQSATSETLKTPPRNPKMAKVWQHEMETRRDIRMQPFVTRITELETMKKANKLKQEASEIQSKIEFQTLIVQLFMQRRFQHVVIGSRFYRGVFGDGDTTLKLEGEAKKFFADYSGMPPTLGVLDSLANEAMRDVREGVEAYTFLLKKGELASATQRLGETFLLGEYMPEVRLLSREDKRKALTFAQKSNRLLSTLEVRDYGQAEKLVEELEKMAKDFDSSKARAAINTAKTISTMHLTKARAAAMNGDSETLEKEVKKAGETWPQNPELTKLTSKIYSQAEVQQQALADLDRLISQKNYRQIFDDKIRYIAATALYPERQEQLKGILEDMQTIEGAIIRANEISKREDYAGAWESVEQAFLKFKSHNDPKLNEVRANLTTEAADFVRSIRTAQQLEEKEQIGSSLAWYLRAQKLYPMSQFASEGIERMVKHILPKEREE